MTRIINMKKGYQNTNKNKVSIAITKVGEKKKKRVYCIE